MNAQTLQNHRSRYSGFTLVELIVVIVILGALAAAALPKFMNLKSEAQTAAVTQLAGTLRSAAEMFKMKCIASGGTANTLGSLTLNGVTRAVWYCYPVENSRGNGWWGINELVNTQGFDYTYQTTPYPGKAYFSPTGATDAANCRVTYIYQEPTSPLTITTTTSGC